jgi:GTP-binding protein HflX
MKNGIAREAVILVGVVRPPVGGPEVEENLEELAQLVRSAGGEVKAVAVQKKERPDPATFIGRGKVEELAGLVKALPAKTVVFDDDLTPSQVQELEERLDAKVMDRPWLILSLFAQRARTDEARTQVSLAQYRYLLPRLAGRWTHFSRPVGGFGMTGGGETQLELDRRMVRKRIRKLEADLEAVERTRRELHKSHAALPRVALPGDTNPGNSTLFNALTGSSVYADDRLFATLDARVARVNRPSALPLLFSDTVGFIRKLPHHLIAAFRSTLGEAAGADLVLNVVDRSHPRYAEHEAIGLEVLEELEIGRERVLTVYNKADRVPGADGAPFPMVSAATGQGLDGLVGTVEERLLPNFRLARKPVPWAEIARLDGWKKNPMTVRVTREADGCVVEYWMRL